MSENEKCDIGLKRSYFFGRMDHVNFIDPNLPHSVFFPLSNRYSVIVLSPHLFVCIKLKVNLMPTSVTLHSLQMVFIYLPNVRTYPCTTVTLQFQSLCRREKHVAFHALKFEIKLIKRTIHNFAYLQQHS